LNHTAVKNCGKYSRDTQKLFVPVVMASGSPFRQYDFPDHEDSPLRSYKPVSRALRDVTVEKLACNINTAIETETESTNVDEKTSPCSDENNSTSSYDDYNKVSAETVEKDSENLTDQDISSESGFTKIRTSAQRTVVYMHSEDLIWHCDKMLKIPGRVSIG